MLYADIIVDISHENLDKTYQYRIPDSLQAEVGIGTPVYISFGNGNRRRQGYVVGLSEQPKIEEARIKEIDEVIPKGVVIESRMIALAYWMKQNFGGTMNDALRTVLSVKKSVRPMEHKRIVLAVSREKAEELLKEYAKKHYVAKARLIKELLEYQPIPREFVLGKLNVSPASLRGLEQQGIISTIVEEEYRKTTYTGETTKKQVILNAEQQNAVDVICREYEEGKRNTYLIHGVTGSGKTEVYLNVIEQMIAQKKQVIVLIPEIALTYQTVRRFSERFGERVAFLHSKLSQGERYDQYRRAKDGDIDTGMLKVGAMLGDHVEIGCGSVLNPGTVIGRNSNVYPLSSVRQCVDENSIYKKQGEVAEKR